jgi:hypothetical protein
MFESITKKSFIDLLKKSENELIFSRLNLSEKGSEKVMQALYNGTFEVKQGRRCTAANTNSITFTGGSKLYFNPGAKYYKHNNVIIKYGEEYDTFDELYKYSIIAYVIK